MRPPYQLSTKETRKKDKHVNDSEGTTKTKSKRERTTKQRDATKTLNHRPTSVMDSVGYTQELHNARTTSTTNPTHNTPNVNEQSIEASERPHGKSRANHWHTRTIHRKTLHYSHGRERSPIQPAPPKSPTYTNTHPFTNHQPPSSHNQPQLSKTTNRSYGPRGTVSISAQHKSEHRQKPTWTNKHT